MWKKEGLRSCKGGLFNFPVSRLFRNSTDTSVLPQSLFSRESCHKSLCSNPFPNYFLTPCHFPTGALSFLRSGTVLPLPSAPISRPPQPCTSLWRIALRPAQVLLGIWAAWILTFWKFTVLLSTVPDIWLQTPFVGGVGFNSAKASRLPREGEKEGHLGIF